MVSCRIHGVKNLTAQGKRREREGADARREERKEVIVSSGSTVPPGPILLTPGRATRAQRYLLCSTHSVKNTLCSDQSLKDYVVHAQQLRKWSPQLSVCVPISISICVSDPLSLSSSLSLYPLFRPPLPRTRCLPVPFYVVGAGSPPSLVSVGLLATRRGRGRIHRRADT